MRGIQTQLMLVKVPMRRRPEILVFREFAVCTRWWCLLTRSRITGRSFSPSWVRTAPFFLRVKRVTESSCSRDAMAWLTPPWV